MNKNTVIFIKYHTVEEGKDMDREKLNLKLHNILYKRTLLDDIIALMICGITIVMLIVALVIYFKK